MQGLISKNGLDNQLAFVEATHRGCQIKNWWLSFVDGNLVLEVEFKTRGGALHRETSILNRNVKMSRVRRQKGEH
jgi:hypothetical protein